jgi:hypothetical protein
MHRIMAGCAMSLLLMPGRAGAQESAARLAVSLDAPAPDSAYAFAPMPPGWHVTMGPGAVLSDSTHRAEGRFVVEAEIFLFPNSGPAEYGIVLGRRGLEWTGFLARRDGNAAIVRRGQTGTMDLVAWEAHDSVPQPGTDPARVVLRVEAEADSTRFLVNGQRVGSVPRTSAVDGAFGLRVGPGVNVHVSRLDYTRRLAPPRGE